MIERDWLLRLDLYGDEKANEPNIDEINIACVISNTPVIHGFIADRAAGEKYLLGKIIKLTKISSKSLMSRMGFFCIHGLL